MNVAIIGAGVTGLSAAWKLLNNGVDVTIFEKGSVPGGLASGFKDDRWDWSLERHYHHIFTTDDSIRHLADEIGHTPFFLTPKTSVWTPHDIYRFDGPIEILQFPEMSMVSKLRLATGMAFLKAWPNWKSLEGITAKDWIIRVMGQPVWETIWEPLFRGKFGKYADEISAVWFWARIHSRSRKLGYFEQGFQGFVDALVTNVEDVGAKLRMDVDVTEIIQKGQRWEVRVGKKKELFDQVIVAAPRTALLSLTDKLSSTYKDRLEKLRGIGAVTLVLALKGQLMNDNTYWLNVNRKAPFLAVVEHTNMIDPKHYGGDHLVYVGNYLLPTHKYFTYSEDQLIEEYLPALQDINPEVKKSWVRKAWVFKAGFAQPLVPTHYSDVLPDFDTGLSGLWWAGMELVYPWDRGTNFAVEWGWRVADKALKR